MTDVDITKALECCAQGGYECIHCPLKHMKDNDCTGYLAQKALERIKRQEAMIDRLWDKE